MDWVFLNFFLALLFYMFKWCFKKRVSIFCGIFTIYYPSYTPFNNADSDISISGGDYK